MTLSTDRDEPGPSRRGFLRAAGAASVAGAIGTGVSPSGAAAQSGASRQPHARFGDGASGTVAIEPEGAEGIRSWSAMEAWSSEPQMRLRVSRGVPDPCGAEHFMIIPYRYGAAIEYNGIVECWVNEWSIHNHGEGYDVAGAKLWVGNRDDTGGLFMSATSLDGARYGEIVSQKLSRESGGDLRFVVRAEEDRFQFRAGAAGSERTVVQVTGAGVLDLRPSGPSAMTVEEPSGGSALRVTSNGQLFARYERPEQTWIGAAGPANEAGMALGPASDVRVYRAGPRRAAVDGRLHRRGRSGSRRCGVRPTRGQANSFDAAAGRVRSHHRLRPRSRCEELMNPNAILALISDLYTQVTVAQERIAELEQEPRGLKVEASERDQPRPATPPTD
jgi:hypothetical protein